MQIRVDKDNLRIIKLSQLESGEVDVTEVNFIFTPEYKDLIKTAVFTLGDKSYKVILQNDKCYIPLEVLVEGNKITIGVYAFKSEGEELILRYSPVPVTAEILKGSYVEEAENTSHPTPTEIEQLMNLIQSNTDSINDLSDRVDTLEQDKDKCCRDIDSIKDDLIDIKSDIQDLEDDVTSIRSDINNINENIEDIESEILDINADISNINTSITNIERVDERQNRRLNSIDNFIRQWPKTDYKQGTSINLGKTIQATVQYEDDKVLYGNAEQEGTPTPTEPIPISVVTGTQEVVVRGKNRISGVESGNYNQTTGEKTTGTGYRNANPIPVTPNSTYTFSINGTAKNINIFEYTSNNTFIGKQASANSTFTTSDNCYYVNFYRGAGDGDEYWQLESGSIATSYEPYITPTTYTLHLTGKNLFNKEEIDLINALTTTTGLLSPSNSYRFCGYIPVTPLSTYYLSLSNKTITFYDKHRHFLGSHVVNGNFFTAWDTARYVGFNITQEQYNTKTQDTLMFSQSSTEVPYEPYNSIELAKIGDYADEIVYDLKTDKWYKKGYIGKVVLNGSESWNSASAINNHYRYYIDFPSGKADTSLICYSNYFKGVSRVNLLNENELATNQFINILSDTFTSLADLKTWLSTHNTEVYYVLATETDEEITDETLIQDLDNIYAMMSVEGTTIIEVSGNLPGIIKVRAYAQLQAAT